MKLLILQQVLLQAKFKFCDFIKKPPEKSGGFILRYDILEIKSLIHGCS